MSEEVKQEPELELTDAQKDAVYTIDKNVAVSAGAGSGKTQVLSLRFLYILEKLGLEAFLASHSGDGALQAKAEQIMAVTFTKAAATQMRERIRKAMNKRIAKAEAAIDEDNNAKIVRFWRLQLKSLEKAHIDTLHSLCSKILRENPVDAGIDPQFRVAEDVEGKVFVKDTIVDFVRRGLRNGDQDITKLAGIYGYQSLCDNLYSLYSKIEDILADEQAKVRYSDAVAENENGKQAAQNLIKQIEHLIEKKDEVTNNGSEGRNKLDKLAAAFEQIKGDLLQKKPSYDSCKEYFNNLRLKKGSEISLKLYRDLMSQIDMGISNTLAADQIDHWLRVLESVLKTVQAAKQKHNLMTFDDLEMRAVALMRNNPVICKKYADKFTHIMVDEFQDTNERQRQLLYMLCGGSPTELKGKKLFIVGDSKQSIYRFRGAEVQVFAEVCKDITNNGLYVPMDTNFRSLDYILDVVNGTFGPLMENSAERGMTFEALKANVVHNPEEYEKKHHKHRQEDLLLAPKKPEFIQIMWPKGQDGKRKAEAVAIVKKMQEVNRELQEKNGDTKSHYGEMAILLRTMTDAGDIINTLQEQGIAYEMENKNFYELQEVLDIINLFKALLSKNNELELAGILRSPYFGLDDTTLTKLFLVNKEKKLWDNLLAMDIALAEEQAALAQHARHFLVELKEAVTSLGPMEVWETIWQKLHPDYVLSCQPRGEIKLANLNILRNSCAEYCLAKGASLAQWLEYVAELRENGGEEKGTLPTDDNAVKIYSIHKSKGLEFSVVFVAQLDKRYNADRTSVRYLPKFGLGIRNQLEDGTLEDTGILRELKDANHLLEQDERVRQMYVAMTRAKERLYLTGIVEQGEPSTKNPSGLKYAEWMGKLNNIYSQETNNYIEMVQLDGETDFGSASCSAMEEQNDIGLTIADEYISPLGTYLENGPRSFSPSSLQTYLHCQRKYFYQYVLGLPQVEVSEEHGDVAAESGGEAAAALASGGAEAGANPSYDKLSPKDLGSIVHRALELYKGDLEPALERAIQENAPLYQGDEARVMLEHYLASPLYKSIPKQQKRELAFAVYEKQGLLINGIIDCLGFHEDGSLLLVDYKTGKPPVAGEVDKGYAYQLAIYEKVARERWGRAQAGKPVPRIISELHFLQNNTSWSLEKHAQAKAVDYYAEAIALCEAISHKTQESEFVCRQYGEQGLDNREENLQNAVTALAPCKYCPYNYVCNHK
ncbi:MAG: UvrD-helicase domain-containing protein [Phascolarctobacterium sp.]|nr:UvrD-helicase domain-containing protein [Phascolarctobacterium sp.]